jgi:hypothetical protein
VSNEPLRVSREQTRFRWMLVVVWLVVVACIIFCADRRLLRPVFSFITGHPGFDKIGHFMLIGSTAFLLNIAFSLRTWRVLGYRWLLGGTLVAVAFTLEEISQLWFPSRTFDLLDLASDYAGILCFGWLAKRLFKPREQV